MPELTLPVSEEEYRKAGSKFIAFPPGAKKGDVQYRNIEIGIVDWDNPGKSIKFPITIVEDGADQGKADKLSAGVDAKGVWKAKEVYQAITGEDMPMKKTSAGNRPVINPDELKGKAAVGVWTMVTGQKQSGAGDEVTYPKLTALLAEGSKPAQAEML